ncbi:MAG: glycosyltransferase family 39 protein [Candidatus Gracilibacteria bacterium]|nr:glycosyltransferase family 39 protein [bacterium]MDZ4216844.1 glycosyltransferase family 39 protein [Candidatus Gracilibacteria bacterium]
MPELLQSFLIFVGLHLLLFTTANTVIWRFFESELRDVFDWLILFFVVTAAAVLLIMGFIGFLDYFSLLPQVLGTALCLLLFALPIPFLGRHFRLGPFAAWNMFRQLLFRQHRSGGHQWIWAVFGFLILFGAIELFNAFIQFPWEYDTIAYHMPIVVEWIQQHSLWDVFYAAWGGPLGYYPSNHELMVSWLVLPFGHDYLANLMNFWIIALMVVVTYKIMREMGVGDFLSWLAGALVMVMPIFLRQMGTGQVDMLMALGVVISWYYFLRSYKRQDGLLLFPVLFSMAIMLGTKYLSVVYILPLLVIFFFLAGAWRKTHRLWWLWFLLVLGTLGSMWYWRNLILTGNPIFPADVRIGDLVLFQGYTGLTERIQELSLWNRLTEHGEYREWVTAMITETGWHLYLVVMAYVLLVIEMIYKLLFSHMERGEGKFYTLMLFFLPAYWYLYFITPYTASMMNHNVRYAMPWLMLAMIMVVYVVHKLRASQQPFVIALMGVLWWQFLVTVPSQRSGDQAFLELRFVYENPTLFALLFFTFLFAFLFFDVWRKRLWWRHGLLVLSLAVGFFFLQQAVVVRSDLRNESWQHKYDFPLMKAYEWLDHNVSDDVVIANSLNPLYYPLYGENLMRRVRYININDCRDCDYYRYQQKGQTLRENADYDAWKANLKAFGAEYLVLGYSIRDGLEDVLPYELDWVAEHPESFDPVFEQDGVGVYEIL